MKSHLVLESSLLWYNQRAFIISSHYEIISDQFLADRYPHKRTGISQDKIKSETTQTTLPLTSRNSSLGPSQGYTRKKQRIRTQSCLTNLQLYCLLILLLNHFGLQFCALYFLHFLRVLQPIGLVINNTLWELFILSQRKRWKVKSLTVPFPLVANWFYLLKHACIAKTTQHVQ